VFLGGFNFFAELRRCVSGLLADGVDSVLISHAKAGGRKADDAVVSDTHNTNEKIDSNFSYWYHDLWQ
jgi:hypothetical protein